MDKFPVPSRFQKRTICFTPFWEQKPGRNRVCWSDIWVSKIPKNKTLKCAGGVCVCMHTCACNRCRGVPRASMPPWMFGGGGCFVFKHTFDVSSFEYEAHILNWLGVHCWNVGFVTEVWNVGLVPLRNNNVKSTEWVSLTNSNLFFTINSVNHLYSHPLQSHLEL